MKQKKIKGGIKSEEFFRMIAIHAGVQDLQTVKNVYYGMLRTISKELKHKRVCPLPNLGEFYIKVMDERRSIDINTRLMITIPSVATVKFTPCEGIREYFHDLNKLV